jgi:ParB family chromosome partitioning protein
MAAKRTRAPKKQAAPAEGAPKPKRTRKKAVEAGSRGLAAAELGAGEPPPAVQELVAAIAADGGSVLAAYREPIGAHWAILAGLPVDRVEPTPFQRDLSAAHTARLADVIDRLDRFLDPIITVRTPEGVYWTPNGHHRTAAVRAKGGRAIVALVLPDREVAYKILALNTEKAHNLREKAAEVIRMARSLADLEPRAEKDYALEFEEPSLLTLGRAYAPLLKRIDAFLDDPLPRALEIRGERATQLLALDDAVTAAVDALKARGLESPFLRTFVVARVNPLRFLRGAAPPYEATLEKMLAAAKGFDPASVRPDHLARTGGPPPEE